ncbi:hypothetical protein LPJ64_003959 [Coemansia asiatica]|uniref:AAA+ ATPase domain-containing protein n=1 Tax=Coemansia asiatica TaxID=1052880 RepID=A0A9W8CJJ6_9FUNG|nr:hypothetical protein LPJ64_003959 [Coemansia asiatica]
MPLSSKRAHAASAVDKSKGSSNSAPSSVETQQSKRQKQKSAESVVGDKRGRKPKAVTGKPTSIHTFFAVNSKHSVVHTEEAIAMSIDGGSAAEAHAINIEISDVSSANSDLNNADFAFPESGIEAIKPKRPLFRSTGVPAPYPTENAHVPSPTNEPFAYRQASLATGYLVDTVDTACIFNTQSDIAHNIFASSADGGCAQWLGYFKSNVTNLAKHSSYNVRKMHTVIRAILAVLGPQTPNILSVPTHLEPIVPLLEICSKKPAAIDELEIESTQLLSLRYRPKKAREVLDNRRAVLRLYSWIDGMRLRRSTAIAEKIFCSESKDTLNSSSGSKGRSLKWATSNTNSREDSRKHAMDTSSDCGTGSSDDDFMPQKPQRYQKSKRPQRPRKFKDELDDVFAWAQSDGSISSFRENKLIGQQRHRRQGSSDSANASASESEPFTNVVLLEGPSGSGKTAAVYACAEECGFEVYEINPGQRRSGKDVLEVLEDVIMSHTITNSATSTTGKASTSINQLLILIEEVDVLFEQDQRLWPALKQLALKSRRPIVLTCTDSSCFRWETFGFHFVLRFFRPSESVLVPYCFLLCLCEGALVSPTDISSLCKDSKCDLNRIICELDMVIRQVKSRTCLASSDSVEQSPDLNLNLDIGGTLAWILSPLEPEETPESRYRFWISLIESIQPKKSTDSTWYSLWPDPPPSFEPPVLANEEAAYPKSRMASAHKNSFFAQKARAAAMMASDNPLSIASMFISKSSALDRSALPLFSITVQRAQTLFLKSRTDQPTLMHDSIDGIASQCSLVSSMADSLELVTAALDTLSLCCTITGDTPIHRECLKEPLHSYSSPMTDSCIEVNYVVLDYGVISRKNSMLLPDSASSTGKQTSADIDLYLRHYAAETLTEVVSSKGNIIDSFIDKSDFDCAMQSDQYKSLLSFSKTDISKESAANHQLRTALDFVRLKPQRYGLDQIVQDAGYLSYMVKWDWIHQGKEPAPAPSATASKCGLADGADDTHLHLYRIGMRRTRMNTYRAHIKHMPADMQHFIVNWGKFY